jgi:endogenous inhibitor of DNA gyrase (YacG/DUF329 family)
MRECPHCGSELERPASTRSERGDADPGGKSTETEVVNCPDCDRVIDGFTPH